MPHRCHECEPCQTYEGTVLELYEPAILEAAKRLGVYQGQDVSFAAREILGQPPHPEHALDRERRHAHLVVLVSAEQEHSVAVEPAE